MGIGMLKLNRAKAKWRVKLEHAFNGQGTDLFSIAIVTLYQFVCKVTVVRVARANGHSSCFLWSPSCARAWRPSFLSEASPWASQQHPSQLRLLLALCVVLSAASLSTLSPAAPVSIVPDSDYYLAECPILRSVYCRSHCHDELPFAHWRWPVQQSCLGLPRKCVQPSVRPSFRRFCYIGS